MDKQLPPDIIANILSRLPVKYLLRSKCVSKPWRALISDPQFAKLHLTQSQKDCNINPQRVLVSTNPIQSIDYDAYDGSEDGSKGVLELDYPASMENDPEMDVDFVGSCNGLIVVVDYEEFILWNPSTRESRPLPKPKHHPNSLSDYGLGYDFSTDDYNLVRVTRHHPQNGSDIAKVEVLSMKTNVWRRIPDLKTDHMNLDGCGIFLNGSLHFLARKVSGQEKILSFDLAEEIFQELVPLPDRLEENHYAAVIGLGVSAGCLCLFIWWCGENLYEGWLMMEFGVKSSWSRLFSSTVDPWPGYKYYQSALCYTKNGKVVINFDGYRLDMYDPKEQRFENIAIRNNWDWFHSIAYSESLVSPNF